MRPARPVDLLLVGLLAVTGVLEVALGSSADHRWWTTAVVTVLTVTTLALRSSWPLLCLLLVVTLVVLTEIPGTGLALTGTMVVACLVALGNVGRHCPDPPSTVAVILTTATFVIGAAFTSRPWDVVISCLACGAAWGAGRLLRREAHRNADLTHLAADLMAQKEVRAREAVQAERIRIAREVHDTIAHTVSVMTLQVGGVRRRLETDGARATERDVLLGVENLGRDAVAELHHILGVLRTTDEDRVGDPASSSGPRPCLAEVPRLAARVRATGVPVDVRIEGVVRQLPEALELAGYRVVQEALTNVLKHGSAAATRVTISYSATDISLAVEDDGGAVGRDVQAAGTGAGLAGLRERVAIHGGRVEAGPTSARGFSVRATIPTGPVPTS